MSLRSLHLQLLALAAIVIPACFHCFCLLHKRGNLWCGCVQPSHLSQAAAVPAGRTCSTATKAERTHTERERDKQTDGQTDRQTDRQTERQKERISVFASLSLCESTEETVIAPHCSLQPVCGFLELCVALQPVLKNALSLRIAAKSVLQRAATEVEDR